MIKDFIARFDAKRDWLLSRFAESTPGSYGEIVSAVIEAINPDDDYGLPSPKRVHKIDDGDYQGTLVFVIGASGYQPSKYWATRVSYGSCSGCDTLQAIEYSGKSEEEMAKDFLTEALHILQHMSEIP